MPNVNDSKKHPKVNLFANDHDNQIDNKSGQRCFNDFLKNSIKRRDLIKGGTAAAISTFIAGTTSSQTTFASLKNENPKENTVEINFTPVSLADGNGPTPSISSDYKYEVLIPWGEPLEPLGPDFKYPTNHADQAEQIGIGHDGMTYFPLDNERGLKSNRYGMLALNHEFGSTQHVLGKPRPTSLDDVRTVQHAHGVSIVAIAKTSRSGKWTQQANKNSRRIHVNTPVEFSGPAAHSKLLKTKNGNAPLGTVNNCSNGETPWGTYLTCEENFNGYFGSSNQNTEWSPTVAQKRYGFSKNGFGYDWHHFDKRFE